MSVSTSKIKKKKKNITLGVVYIKATFNNTIVTFTDVQGNAIAASTAGGHGFKGAKKATPYAAQVTVNKASEDAKEHGVKTVSIRVQGAGAQRESAMRAVFGQNFIVTSIIDVSPVAHNGCRPPKRRRV
ncbi:30S ribosomal protein S11 [Candidatus Trichorickettsia mobilis]|uniref:30S ribosomal protein S11 n=1 Tax=Candidatus Trichorickettsia mobilis TaxID=1346319 RepID=UPI00292E396B|nr:30S ribosomal protein S11 [Candidatus Trichorickettsia mobilis]